MASKRRCGCGCGLWVTRKTESTHITGKGPARLVAQTILDNEFLRHGSDNAAETDPVLLPRPRKRVRHAGPMAPTAVQPLSPTRSPQPNSRTSVSLRALDSIQTNRWGIDAHPDERSDDGDDEGDQLGEGHDESEGDRWPESDDDSEEMWGEDTESGPTALELLDEDFMRDSSELSEFI
jgi:hypothetical protein